MVSLSWGALRLLIGTDVGELGRRILQGGKQLGRPLVQFGEVGIGQGVLILRLSDPTADIDVLSWGEEHVGAGHLGKLRPQPVDDLPRRCRALIARLEDDGEAAGIGGVRAVG